MASRKELAEIKNFLIDYQNAVPKECPIQIKSLSDAIPEMVNFLLPEKR